MITKSNAKESPSP